MSRADCFVVDPWQARTTDRRRRLGARCLSGTEGGRQRSQVVCGLLHGQLWWPVSASECLPTAVVILSVTGIRALGSTRILTVGTALTVRQPVSVEASTAKGRGHSTWTPSTPRNPRHPRCPAGLPLHGLSFDESLPPPHSRPTRRLGRWVNIQRASGVLPLDCDEDVSIQFRGLRYENTLGRVPRMLGRGCGRSTGCLSDMT
jgi:hypothetical protein